MDRLDLLMSKCSQDIAEIAASESEITSSSNRLLNELAFVRTSNLTKSDQETVKRNTEAMLNILMTYTNPNTLTNLSAPLSSAHPSQEDKDKNCKMPTSDDEDHQMVHNSVNDFQNMVRSKISQIQKTNGLVNVINETIQKEIRK